MLGLILGFVVVGVRVAYAAAATTNSWETLSGCRFVSESSHDGDSFTLRHQKTSFSIRLYFVDCPETVDRDPTRLEAQGAAFGIDPESALELGREASAFTAGFLRSGCEVLTRRQGAGGLGRQARWYGVVTVGGTNLATELVRRGLARIHGTNMISQRDPRMARWTAELLAAEHEARAAGRGGWDRRRYPAAARAGASATSATSAPSDKPGSSSRLDLNRATRAELEQLPEIGPARAKAIIGARPFRRVEDLLQVPGIHAKTFAAISNLVMVGQSTQP